MGKLRGDALQQHAIFDREWLLALHFNSAQHSRADRDREARFGFAIALRPA